MALNIEQQPYYKTLAAGQEIIFVISESTNIVTQQQNVKFIAELYVGVDSSNMTSIGKYKASPNDAGVGIFDVGEVLENYISPDYSGVNGSGNTLPVPIATSTFRTIAFDDFGNYHPIHLIDRFCIASDSIKYFAVTFKIEYLGAVTENVVSSGGGSTGTVPFLMFNGVIYDTDILTNRPSSSVAGFGYNLIENDLILKTDGSGRGIGGFLTDAPLIQYARATDYGTLPFLNNLYTNSNSFQVGPSGTVQPITNPPTINNIKFKFYDSSDVQIGGTYTVSPTGNGGYSNLSPSQEPFTTYSTVRLCYFGAFPGNLENLSALPATTSYYTIQAQNNDPGVNGPMGVEYRINIITGDCRYETIRLTWLNKYGTWDYYTFTKKSVKSIQTNRTNYTQLSGTWNKKQYHLRDDKGGQKNFRVNSKQKIKINTDFISADESVWFEQLINSTDVFILGEYQGATAFPTSGNIHRYVQPVVLTTSNYIRKTIGNDKLIQYTFDLERVTDRRTQRV